MPNHQIPLKKQLLADSALAAVTLVWGATFVMVKDVIEQVSPMLFLAVRFAWGALALALIALLMGRWRSLSWREIRWGALIGVALWAGYALQTIGLQWTTASNGGFITGLSVMFVPVFGLVVLKHWPHRWAVLGVVMATIGLALLSLRLEGGINLNLGDALVFGCAVAFAVQIVLIAHVASWADPLRLALVQIAVAGLLSAASAALFERPVASISLEIWAAAAFLGITATAAAIVIQVSVQRFTTAVHTALIFTLEPVFAAIFGVWLQGDRLGPIAISGAALILIGMLVAELGPQLRALQSRQIANRQHNEPRSHTIT
jgi:drug/metabolite transporter (DMT)-like permease